MLRVENLSKSYGSVVLFDGVSFSINPRERVGLTGRNGHGKTTLFRLIIGEEHPDSGVIAVPKNYAVGHVSQHLAFSAASAVDEACQGLPEEERSDRWRAEKVLAGLGFGADEMLRPPSELSGGFQVRLNLARALLAAPDLLLLDEPTNYLDIASIRWLSRFLSDWKGELMLITHDRSFMDGVVTHTMGIHRKKIRKIKGDTGKLYEQIAKEEEIYEKTRLNDEKKRREMELFISRFRAKARLANMVQSRIKTLEKRERLDRLEKIRDLEFSFNLAPFTGRHLLSASGLAFSYSGGPPFLFEGLDIAIGKNDRVCVIGKNGRGKTTLLKVLAGELSPVRGEVSGQLHLKTGYYAQTNTTSLRPTFSVEEEIASGLASSDRQTARNICGSMLFEGDDALKPIRVLSGGEKARVLLGKTIATPANLLLLDEPSNHLDMGSCDALLEALGVFEGAIVMVTHNEMFLHALATRIVAFQGGRASVHEGSYRDFLDRVGWEDEDEAAPGRRTEGREEGPVSNKKEFRRIRTEIISRRAKALKPLEKRMAEMEKLIAEEESASAAEHEALVEASQAGDGGLIASLSKSAHDRAERIDALYEELDGFTRLYEDLSTQFDVELAALGGEGAA
ncbi:MAG: ABC-F family ATP-binding cassette domain-containing protein [Spirochaetota bacterium]|nr:ABC-F family ATP-binding cassette domain-containing protein [Spirochaetota bacterium]HPV98539.1 ABC-F family ATP-binding cassette domain-containing protein [Spirochaetota bacterium]